MERATGTAAGRLFNPQAFYRQRHVIFFEDDALGVLIRGLGHLNYRYICKIGCNQDRLRGKASFPRWRLVMRYSTPLHRAVQ
ncbi:MAG: hypothetical protein IPK23_03040 [Rhizobiales bacterium]|nr:hypothetical protein [Hyphomicrobiales bacterium]